MISKIIVCVVALFVVAVSCVKELDSIPSNFDTSQWIVNETHNEIPGGGAPDVVGAFRFLCTSSHLAYDDPVVYPGQPGKSHLHQFFGNTLANAHSTYESLRKTGNSTCVNILNRSSYWMPAMLDARGGVVVPDWISIYYKRLPKTDPNCQVQGKECVHTPRGLRMVFGYEYDTDTKGDGYFNCQGPTATPGRYNTLVEAGKHCPVGNLLGAMISTPSCWDGVNLDSPNHRDHLTQPSYGSWGYLKCPPTHQYVIPTFTLGAWYTVDGNLSNTGKWDPSVKTWHLSSDEMVNGTMAVPGTTFHADWFGAWDDPTLNLWHDHCIDNLLSCSGGQLGDGRYLKAHEEFKWVANPHVVPLPANPQYPAKPTNPTNPTNSGNPTDDKQGSASSVIISLSLVLLAMIGLLF